MPATRHTRRTSAAPYKPYGPYPLDIFMLQASILEKKRALEMMTNVPDEVRQQSLNLLDDSVPEAPPGSPPYSPSSPVYSPVVQSPIMEYPDWTSETTNESPKTFSDDDNDEPLVE